MNKIISPAEEFYMALRTLTTDEQISQLNLQHYKAFKDAWLNFGSHYFGLRSSL